MFFTKGKFVFKETQLLRNKNWGALPNLWYNNVIPEWKRRFPSAWFGEEYPPSTEDWRYHKNFPIKHPTVKGLEFIKWLILLTTDEGDTVVDPFLGSGTTALACKQLNRTFIGSEIDKDYCKLAQWRLDTNV